MLPTHDGQSNDRGRRENAASAATARTAALCAARPGNRIALGSRMANARFCNGWDVVRRIAALVVAALLVLAFAATPPPQQAVTLTATDYTFAPAEIHAVAGRPLRITVTNNGMHTHGLRLALSYGEVPLPMNIPAGRTVTAVVDNLGEPGSYKFYCPVDDHQHRGMVGTIVVEPAAVEPAK
jgi:plastocyanin